MPPITIFCPFTRVETVHRWFEDLASTDLIPMMTNLALIVDCNEPIIYARIMEHMNKVPFRKFLIYRNYEHEVISGSIIPRRQRIAEIHEQSKAMVAELDGEYVLGLEDDTVFTGLNVKRLLEVAAEPKVGLATAYEAGRWYNKIIGVWDFDNVEAPTECWTLLPSREVEEVDACGFYCYVTKKNLYLEHKYYSETWQPWGPDVNYGLWLRQQGYKNYVDWTQPCGHQDGGVIITPDSQLYSEHFYLDKHPEFDNGAPQWLRRKQ